MAFDLSDVLSRLGSGGYGQDVRRVNALEDAPLMAQKIIDFQKQQRAAPFIKALQGYGAQYGGATTDTDRQSINNAANLARSEFVKSGGSPYDLPSNLWGGDPAKGFQTGAGSYAAPYAGDNLTLGQKMKRAPFTGMFEGKPTAEYGQYLASPEAQSWYLPLAKQKLESDIAASNRSNRGCGGSGLTPYQVWQINRTTQQDAVGAKQKAWDDAVAAAKADTGRLSFTGAYSKDEKTGKELFTMPQLIDAYYQENLKRMGISEQGSAGNTDTAAKVKQALDMGKSPAEVRQALIDDGEDPANYGL